MKFLTGAQYTKIEANITEILPLLDDNAREEMLNTLYDFSFRVKLVKANETVFPIETPAQLGIQP